MSEQCSIIGRETDELHFIPVNFHLTFDVAVFVLAVLLLWPFWTFTEAVLLVAVLVCGRFGRNSSMPCILCGLCTLAMCY